MLGLGDLRSLFQPKPSHNCMKTSKLMKPPPGCHLPPQPAACQEISRKTWAGLCKQRLKSSSTHGLELPKGLTKTSVPWGEAWRGAWAGLQEEATAPALEASFQLRVIQTPPASSLCWAQTRKAKQQQAQGWETSRDWHLGAAAEDRRK